MRTRRRRKSRYMEIYLEKKILQMYDQKAKLTEMKDRVEKKETEIKKGPKKEKKTTKICRRRRSTTMTLWGHQAILALLGDLVCRHCRRQRLLTKAAAAEAGAAEEVQGAPQIAVRRRRAMTTRKTV